MNFIDTLLQELSEDDRGIYISALREVVKSPGVGGMGEYLGSLVPLVFATDEEKIKAIKLMNDWKAA
jgi:hypothetical protein